MRNEQKRKEALPARRDRLKLIAAAAFLGIAGAASATTLAYHPGDALVRQAGEQEQVSFALTLPLRNQDELNQLIHGLYTPGSPQFHKYLSSAEFDARFGPTQQQYETLKSLAQQYGLSIVGEHSSRTLLNVQASTATIRNVFGSRIQVLKTAEGREYFDVDREAALPFPLSAIGADVAGMRQHPLSSHIVSRRPVAEAEVDRAAQPHSGTQSGGSYAPADIKTAYNLNGIQNGGTPVALFELSSAKYSDSATYASKFGLTNTTLTQKTVDGGTSTTTGSTEVMLDIEMVMATANPSAMYIYTGPNSSSGVLDTYTQIADDNLVKEVSTSWGLCESSEGSSAANAEATAFTKMVSEGIAIFAAAGDSGAYDCGGTSTLAVDDPASQPNVTGVGGTNLTTTSTQTYTSEKVWDTSSTEGGGGGISTLWSIPSWQTGVAAHSSSTQLSTTKRMVPDVALDADPATGYYIYDSDGCRGWCVVGGTSDAAPQWAAFWSLIGKGLGSAPGFANPTIYSIAEGSGYSSDFHDVSSGTNNHFNAVTGYDPATGWGSYNGGNLYTAVISAVGGGSSSSSSSGGGSSSSSSSSSSGGSSSSSSSSSSSGGGSSSSSSSSGGSSSSSGGSGAPAAPTGLTASGTTYGRQGAVILNWNASTGATRYYVYMGTSPGGESSTALGYVTSPGAEVTGLSTYTRYYFKVKAYDSKGYSAYSNEASAETR